MSMNEIDQNSQLTKPCNGYVFLVEDDTDLRDSISEMLRFVGYHVHAYPTARAFLDSFHRDSPAVLITDVRMPEITGVDLQAELINRGINLPTIFISGQSTVSQSVTAMKQGAFDFLTKPFRREQLLSVVAKGIAYENERASKSLEHATLQQKLEKLSPRERQVFSLVAKGYSNAELAETLGVATSTVKEYKSDMMFKLGLSGLSDIIALNTAITKLAVVSEHLSQRPVQ